MTFGSSQEEPLGNSPWYPTAFPENSSTVRGEGNSMAKQPQTHPERGSSWKPRAGESAGTQSPHARIQGHRGKAQPGPGGPCPALPLAHPRSCSAVPKNRTWPLQVPMCGGAAERGVEIPPFQGYPGGQDVQHIPKRAKKRGKKDRRGVV